MGYEVVNLGSDQSVKLRDAITLAEKLLGKKAKIEYQPGNPADAPADPANVTKAKNLLDWEPTVDLEAGLARTVDWYLANRAWAKELITH